MAAKLLLDTGAFVALIDRSERQHAKRFSKSGEAQLLQPKLS